MITYVFMGHSLFNIKRQTSNVKRQTSNIKHQTSNIKRQTSNIKYLLSQLRSESIYARYCSFVMRGL